MYLLFSVRILVVSVRLLDFSLVTEESLLAVPVLLAASLVEGTNISGPVALSGAAVVVVEIVLVVRVEVGREDVGVPAGV